MEHEGCGAFTEREPSAARSGGLDALKKAVAAKLRQAAYAMGERAAMSGVPAGVACYERFAADVLDASAARVEKFETGQALEQARNRIRENPGFSLIIAAEAGFLIGAILKRR